mmetsp:Transcript_970/g.1264  ORF Transcript_970/g.1264 Transcript_970/m.1264 type:complete len:158 (+) Transcript_970:481-954(+)
MKKYDRKLVVANFRNRGHSTNDHREKKKKRKTNKYLEERDSSDSSDSSSSDESDEESYEAKRHRHRKKKSRKKDKKHNKRKRDNGRAKGKKNKKWMKNGCKVSSLYYLREWLQRRRTLLLLFPPLLCNTMNISLITAKCTMMITNVIKLHTIGRQLL